MGNEFLEVAMKCVHLLGRRKQKQKQNKNLTKHIVINRYWAHQTL